MSRSYRLCLSLALCLFALPAASHEYWIEAIKAGLKPGETLSANLKVGEDFKGQSQIYAPSRFESFVVVSGSQLRPVRGTIGDLPAVNIGKMPEGLAVLALVTDYSKITYPTFAKFERFAKAHGEDFAIDEHKARNLPKDGFTEAYRRFAKALVAVGQARGNDVRLGMELELVAAQNPYLAKGEVTYVLTRDRIPVADHQVDIFFRAGPSEIAEKSSFLTNAKGEVKVPVRRGETMVSAVKLEQPSEELARRKEVVWYSLWATSTFSIP